MSREKRLGVKGEKDFDIQIKIYFNILDMCKYIKESSYTCQDKKELQRLILSRDLAQLKPQRGGRAKLSGGCELGLAAGYMN